MAEKRHAMHGRDHAAGGADPIPTVAAAAGTYRNPVNKYSVGGAEWKLLDMYATTGITRTVDPTVPFGGYIEISGDTKYFILGAALGPAGSTWYVSIAYRTATDGGLLLFDWKTSLSDGLYTGFGYGAGPFVEALEDPGITALTFYKNDSSLTYHQDFYSAAPGDVYTTSKFTPILVNGAGSTMLSAHGTAVVTSPWAGFSQREMNGGGNGNVIWWLRCSINGKNASSGGYKARIYYIAIRRASMETGYGLT